MAAIALWAPASGAAAGGQLHVFYLGETADPFTVVPGQGEIQSNHEVCPQPTDGANSVLGGGFALDVDTGTVRVQSSVPLKEGQFFDGWRVIFDNPTSVTGVQATEWSVCGRAKGLSYVKRTKTVPAQKRTGLVRSCPRGTSVLGGGALGTSTTAGRQTLIASTPADLGDRGTRPDDGWRAVMDTVDPGQKLTVYAVCAKVTGVHYITRTFRASKGGDSSAFQQCMPGDYLAGGGVAIRGDFGDQALGTSAPDESHTAWMATVGNRGPAAVQASVTAICHR